MAYVVRFACRFVGLLFPDHAVVLQTTATAVQWVTQLVQHTFARPRVALARKDTACVQVNGERTTTGILICRNALEHLAQNSCLARLLCPVGILVTRLGLSKAIRSASTSPHGQAAPC